MVLHIGEAVPAEHVDLVGDVNGLGVRSSEDVVPEERYLLFERTPGVDHPVYPLVLAAEPAKVAHGDIFVDVGEALGVEEVFDDGLVTPGGQEFQLVAGCPKPGATHQVSDQIEVGLLHSAPPCNEGRPIPDILGSSLRDRNTSGGRDVGPYADSIHRTLPVAITVTRSETKDMDDRYHHGLAKPVPADDNGPRRRQYTAGYESSGPGEPARHDLIARADVVISRRRHRRRRHRLLSRPPRHCQHDSGARQGSGARLRLLVRRARHLRRGRDGRRALRRGFGGDASTSRARRSASG